ncbi:MAG: homocysteine S-methyltransferase family protein, partial [Syntrophaceae bacterium]|nr:homocysteine S-methyltransferase family protein [Syntrophaceae bacterium]
MNPLINKLVQEAPVVTDGAWGTQLQNRGLKPGECPDAWNLQYPDHVLQVARAYIEAGSRIILTNTFRANRLALQGYGLAAKAMEINLRGAEISREAASGKAWIFGSIGPSGKILMTGDTTEDELREVFQEQAEGLLQGGADAIVTETMSDLTEAVIALEAARHTGLPVVASMVYDSGKEKDRTMMGITPEQAAEAFAEAGADVIGANCGQGIAGFLPICQRFHQSTELPIWIKANAGMPVLEDGRAVYQTDPDAFAQHVPSLVEAGATFVGGCCGTGPEYIRA